MSDTQVAERPVAQHVVTSENLAEFQLKRMGLAEPQPAADPTPEPETQAEVQSEQPSEEQAQPEGAQPEPEKKPNPKLERRFSDLTKARKEAEARAEAERVRREELEAKLAALQGQAPQQPETAQPAAQADAEPQPHEFSDAFEYAKALAKWSSDQAVKRVKQEEAERKASEERNRVISTWAERIQAAKVEMPDFDDMVASSEVQVTDAVRDAILESEVGPRILYHLAENPELGKKLAGMTVTAQLREIGKLEGRFEVTKADPKPNGTAAPAVAKPRAAAPITPIKAVAAGSAADVDASGEFRGTYQQWKQMRRAGKIK